LNTYQTTDIAIAAYLKVKGLKLLNAGLQKGKRGAHFYLFEDPDSRAHSMAVDFANSAEAAYDSAHRSLKKLVYSTKTVARSELRMRHKTDSST
jgi:hypothetical protein